MAENTDEITKNKWRNLTSLPFPIKALFTGYILVIGLGLMMAGAQILLTQWKVWCVS